MRNIRTLLIQELLHHLKSFKFLLMMILAVSVSLVCVYIQVSDFETRQNTYTQELEKQKREHENIKVYAKIRADIFIPPNPLSIFAKGIEEKAGSKINIDWQSPLQYNRLSTSTNPFLSIFTGFDVLSIIIIIFSIAAIFIVSDTVSGEKELQTIKLIFCNPIKRTELFWAKYIGSLMALIIPLLLVFLSSVLMIVSQSFISVDGDFYLRVLMIFGTSVLYISVFVLISLILSAYFYSSSRVLITGLLIWISVVFIIPNTTKYIVSESIKLPNSAEVQLKANDLLTEFYKKKNEYEKSASKPPTSFWHCDGGILMNFIAGCNKEVAHYFVNEVKSLFPVLQKSMMNLFELELDYRKKLYKQQSTINNILSFTPNNLFSQSVEKIANTDIYSRDENILNQARLYRNQYINYVKEKSDLGLKFFTRMPEDFLKEDYGKYTREELDRYTRDKCSPLDISDLPVYRHKLLFTFPLEVLGLILFNFLLIVFGIKAFGNKNLIIKA